MRLTVPAVGDPYRRRLGWVLSALALALAGCESNRATAMKRYPVKGKVLLSDGKPLANGKIVFVGKTVGLTSPSPIESDGTFTVKSSSGDGLPEGDYRVRIEIDESELPVVKGAPPKRPGSLPFPAKYADEDSSGLTATVTTDETKNNFEFKLSKS
jgi:hypothetical protein